uniref:Uncharacterized protein n=1 Tax=Rhipicephalus zambeziensis TaxID=60191 RepID=A0A224Z1M6_9ACAR
MLPLVYNGCRFNASVLKKCGLKMPRSIAFIIAIMAVTSIMTSLAVRVGRGSNLCEVGRLCTCSANGTSMGCLGQGCKCDCTVKNRSRSSSRSRTGSGRQSRSPSRGGMIGRCMDYRLR